MKRSRARTPATGARLAAGVTGPLPDDPERLLEELYEDAPCGLLSALPDGTISRINRTLLRWLGYQRDAVVGRVRFQSLLSPGDRIFYETHYAPLLVMQAGVREIAVDLLRADGQRLPALLTAIRKPGNADDPGVVHTAVFTTVDRRDYERELLRARQAAEQSEARARVLAATLQASFIPPSPPEIPGLQVGALYRPAGHGDEVGGDFYDIFQTGRGSWALVLGDVCGKGAEAAVVTSLARHTVRAAAMRSVRPRTILGTLNNVLLGHGTGRFLTAVYARISADDQDRVRVTVCMGGHPPPLWAERKSAREVGRPGALLGVFDDPPLHERTVTLQSGDALLFYTDGLTEARRDGELYGVERLRRSLAEHCDEDAQGIADRLAEQALDFQNGLAHDDMALVVLKVPG